MNPDNDIEFTRLCAEAMGLCCVHMRNGAVCFANFFPSERYEPLTNDGQAMALVKKFVVQLDRTNDGHRVRCEWGEVTNADLNRAIVECVAQTQRSKA